MEVKDVKDVKDEHVEEEEKARGIPRQARTQFKRLDS